MSDTEIEEMSTYDSKKMIKRRVRQTVFNELEELKNSHSKVKVNKYNNFDHPQTYINCKEITIRQCALLPPLPPLKYVQILKNVQST